MPRRILAATIVAITLGILLSAPTHAQEDKPDLPAELKQKIDKLLAELTANKFDVRQKAEKNLRNTLLRDTKTFDAVLSYLKRRIETSTSTEARIRLKRATAPYLEFGISGALLKKFPNIAAQLTSPDREVRRKITRELADSNHADAVYPLVKFLGDDDPRVYGVARKALTKIGTAAVESLIKALGDVNAGVRMGAVGLLYEIKDARAVEPLIKVLGDANRWVRSAAVEALSRIIDANAVKPLIKALGNEKACVRGAAAYLLGQLKDARAIEPLVEALGDTQERARSAAACALSRINDRKAVEPLIKALDSPKPYIRAAAAKLLGQLKDARSVDSLVKVLADADQSVRRNAAEALVGMADARAVEPLIRLLGDKSEHVRWAAIEALVGIGKPATESLIGSLDDKNAIVRQAAAYVLGKIAQVRAVEPLLTTLGDNKSYVRAAAATALIKIGKPALEVLKAALENETAEHKIEKLKEIIEKITTEKP